MLRKLALSAMIAALAALAPLAAGAADKAAAGPLTAPARPQVQIAILLDTSGSMDGLIEQAKRQLWGIVNQFITASRDGVRPELRVALYEYGKSSLPADHGYMRQICPLTDDLDKVSQELFALTTNGGDEYCGMVIGKAVAELAWSASREDLKLVYIAGNEPFTQGSVDYRESCKAAITKGIIVNTIHCGDDASGVSGMWADGAKLGEGRYACIDQNAAVAQIAAPQDRRLAELGAELNGTYVAYGRQGRAGMAMQAAQDANAMSAAPAAAAERAASKASSFYRNSSWDMVDAMADGKVKLKDMKDEELPEEMRKMNAGERDKFLAGKAERRKTIQDEILKLQAERASFVAEAERKQAAELGKASLGSVLMKSAREQAEAKNMKF